MSRGLYVLTAIFCSPLYFALRKKWVACAINACIYLTALVTLIFGIGIIFWMVGFAHAMWDLGILMREDAMQRQAELIAEKTRAT